MSRFFDVVDCQTRIEAFFRQRPQSGKILEHTWLYDVWQQTIEEGFPTYSLRSVIYNRMTTDCVQQLQDIKHSIVVLTRQIIKAHSSPGTCVKRHQFNVCGNCDACGIAVSHANTTVNSNRDARIMLVGVR